jgi:hypothetical protein
MTPIKFPLAPPVPPVSPGGSVNTAPTPTEVSKLELTQSGPAKLDLATYEPPKDQMGRHRANEVILRNFLTALAEEGYLVRTEENGFVLQKPLTLARGVVLPTGTIVTFSNMTPGSRGEIAQPGFAGISFKLPNGSSVEFISDRDRKSGMGVFRLSVVPRTGDPVMLNLTGKPFLDVKAGRIIFIEQQSNSPGKYVVRDLHRAITDGNKPHSMVPTFLVDIFKPGGAVSPENLLPGQTRLSQAQLQQLNPNWKPGYKSLPHNSIGSLFTGFPGAVGGWIESSPNDGRFEFDLTNGIKLGSSSAVPASAKVVSYEGWSQINISTGRGTIVLSNENKILLDRNEMPYEGEKIVSLTMYDNKVSEGDPSGRPRIYKTQVRGSLFVDQKSGQIMIYRSEPNGTYVVESLENAVKNIHLRGEGLANQEKPFMDMLKQIGFVGS